MLKRENQRTTSTSAFKARPVEALKAAACPSRILQLITRLLTQAATAGEPFKGETRPPDPFVGATRPPNPFARAIRPTNPFAGATSRFTAAARPHKAMAQFPRRFLLSGTQERNILQSSSGTMMVREKDART